MELAQRIQAIAAGTAPLPAYDRAMGFRLIRWDAAGATMEATVDARYANPVGVLHGGVLMGLADSAMGITVSGLMAPATSCTNTDLHVRFVRGTPLATASTLRATARVVKQGRTIVAMECDITNAAGELVARASSTFLVLQETPPPPPKRL